MRIAGVWRRGKGRFKTGIGIVRGHLIHACLT
jgi:hypothetical protein